MGSSLGRKERGQSSTETRRHDAGCTEPRAGLVAGIQHGLRQHQALDGPSTFLNSSQVFPGGHRSGNAPLTPTHA